MTVSRAVFDETLPPSLLATQVYVLSSDNPTFGIINVLLLTPVTLFRKYPDLTFHS